MFIGTWILPTIATLACLYAMFRPYQQQGDFDITPLFRLFWIAPIGFIWAVYFGVMFFWYSNRID